ncbi:GNAT family N-acetyltransferase [Aeromicrobium sp. NPDC092404]|uniref:GNAT family N-acetyltransferase n=1 Tax=Aeromicrobium sp. NPDC092404 TaxID=3154976 RepID=UPI0034384E4C
MIETDRLTLRRVTAEDADFVFDLYRRPEVARWSGAGTPMTHRDEAVARLHRWVDRVAGCPGAGFFRVTVRATGATAGLVLLVPLPASEGIDRDDMEIGWHFLPDAWGNGFATESAQAMVDRAWAYGMPELHAVTHPDNRASQAVCQRLGMTDLGLRSDWYDQELRAFRLDRP